MPIDTNTPCVAGNEQAGLLLELKQDYNEVRLNAGTEDEVVIRLIENRGMRKTLIGVSVPVHVNVSRHKSSIKK